MKRIKKCFPPVGFLLAIAAVWGYGYIFKDWPPVTEVSGRQQIPSIKIVDRSGALLYEIISEESGRHQPIPYANIPDCIKQATIATEDKNFYTNPGVDLRGILRALWINLRGGETLAGGSTITQQVVRNLLLNESERYQQTLRRKLRESALAWKLTQELSKDEILALYLNQMNYGAAVYGLEAAAQTYFAKPVQDLDLAECSFIAGLPQAPAYYNPFINFEAAKARQQIVLARMEAEGYITKQAQKQAEHEKIILNPTPYPIEAPHFVWMVQAEVAGLLEAGALAQGRTLVVTTSLDLSLQEQAERIIREQIERLANKDIDHNVNNAALIAMDPQTSEILVYVGSADYFNAEIYGAVNMANMVLQPGSALKPVIYAAGFDLKLDQPLTAAAVIYDVTTHFNIEDGKTYTPRNYDGAEHGPVSVRQALASSLNIPAVLVLEDIGIEQATRTAVAMGITSISNPAEYNLTMALGGGRLTLLELTTAYSVLANEGKLLHPKIILEIRDLEENLLYSPEEEQATQAVSKSVAWLISDILSDDDARSLGFGTNSILNIDRQAAVKTGTTTNFHDNWTVGYTPELVTGVWIGNTDHEPMHEVTGLTGAAPVWHQFMRAALNNRPETWYERPIELIQVEVCQLSGQLPNGICQHTRNEWFIRSTEPTTPDSFYRQIWIDTRTNLIAGEDVPEIHKRPIIVFDFPAMLISWAVKNNLPVVQMYDPEWQSEGSAAAEKESAPFVINSPRPNAKYFITSQTSLESQNLAIEITAESTVASIEIWLDGVLLATLKEAPFVYWWQLQAGLHQLWVVAATHNGETVQSPPLVFEVSE